jgi:capsule polysaccharide export protein KpsE/RkpR
VNLISSLLGGRGTIEADLLVGRSNAVFTAVAKKLHQQGHYRRMSVERLNARLRRKVTLESERGSILQISIKDHDPDLARQVIEDFVVALRQRLTTLSRDQADAKRAIASQRMDEATQLYEQSQQVLNDYRASHHFTTPEVQQAVSQGGYVGLQAQLQAAETTLRYLEKTLGPDNFQLQTAKDQIQVLQRQISNLETKPGSGSIQSLAKINPELAKYRDLLRNEGFARGRYDIYKKYLESLTVQEVAAPLNMAVIDPPFIDPQRQFNVISLGLLVLVLAFAVLVEFYLAPKPHVATADRERAADEAEEVDLQGAATVLREATSARPWKGASN